MKLVPIRFCAFAVVHDEHAKGFILYNSQKRCYYNSQCPQGQYCDYYRKCCKSNTQRPCSHHTHCPQGWYCDYIVRICQVGERRCSHNYHCSRDQVCVKGKCQKRQCYYHNQCKQGHQCVNGICNAIPGYCTSQSSCSASQCCAKYYQHPQVGGLCRDRKKAGDWCPMKVFLAHDLFAWYT